MDNIKLTLEKNRSKKSSNTDFYQNLELTQTSRQIPISDISKTVNTYQVFEDDRNSCTKYRITANINTIASNVLVNPMTIITEKEFKYEVNDANRDILLQKIDTINYDYKCGYDIFDNHYLRVNSFKTGETILDFTGTTLGDIVTINKSIENNLIDDNGWLSFTNKTKINNKRMFIDKKPCEKIELFPTREYFSFKPMVVGGKLKNNWNYFITYPYKNDKIHKLVTNTNNINGIPIITGSTITTNEKGEFLKIYTPYKHGLKQGSVIKLKKQGDENNNSYLVYQIGDEIGNNKDYCFLLDSDKYNDLVTEDFLLYLNERRVVNVIDGVDSEYYIRIFRKLPNFELETEIITESNIENKTLFNNVEHTNDNYQLAFSKNIYGDKIQQIQYTDDIDINLLTDNLGRPLTEMYFTCVKIGVDTDPEFNNKYFTKVVSGVDGLPLSNNFNNIRKISGNGSELPIETSITHSGSNKAGFNCFYGDIVEYNKTTVKENIIDVIQHRFNTKQREQKNNSFRTHNVEKITGNIGIKVDILQPRNEGYFYKPHYKIDIKNFSEIINQGELVTLNTCDVFNYLIDKNNNLFEIQNYTGTTVDIYYLVVKLVNNSNFVDFDRVRVYKNNTHKTFNIRLRDDIENCILIPYKQDFFGNVNSINGDEYVFKQYYSYLIPSYSEDIDGGRVFWRDILGEGVFDSESKFTEEISFTNGRLYLNKNFNIFIKRQDPYGDYGLKSNTFPADLYGDVSSDLIDTNKYETPNEIC